MPGSKEPSLSAAVQARLEGFEPPAQGLEGPGSIRLTVQAQEYVGRRGIEPRTVGLKVRLSTIELAARHAIRSWSCFIPLPPFVGRAGADPATSTL